MLLKRHTQTAKQWGSRGFTRGFRRQDAQKEMPAEQHRASSKQDSDAGDLQAIIEDAAIG